MQDICLNLEKDYNILKQFRDFLKFSMYGSYSFYHASSKDKRGVGILLRRDRKFDLIEEFHSSDDNYLIIIIKSGEYVLFLVNVYGPNGNNTLFYKNMFATLKIKLLKYPTAHLILAGDWNCVDSLDRVDLNIDLYDYKSIPNSLNAKELKELTQEMNFVDAFRNLHSEKRLYTYSHWSENKQNMSRLDRFYLSDNLMSHRIETSISDEKLKRIFDHNMIKLQIGSLPIKSDIKLHESTIKEMFLKYIFVAYFYEVILENLVIQSDHHLIILRDIMLKVNLIVENNKKIYDPNYTYFGEHFRDLDNFISQLPEINQIITFDYKVELDALLESILNSTKNALFGHQKIIKKILKDLVNYY